MAATSFSLEKYLIPPYKRTDPELGTDLIFSVIISSSKSGTLVVIGLGGGSTPLVPTIAHSMFLSHFPGFSSEQPGSTETA